ncbi:MAG: hypothetical protein ACR2HP_03100 [Ilumatobacteraceae bacterium]
MADTNTLARSLNDLGLATWFGGSLMGNVGLNGAASTATDPQERNSIASTGWSRWTPVNLGAIVAHLAGGAMLTVANKARVAGQEGVARTTLVRTAVTGAALAATAYARYLGQKQMDHADAPVEAATTPRSGTPDKVAGAQRQQRIVQWSIPALTGVLLVLNAWMGEQQRPTEVASGVLSRLLPGQ